jgi:hypothetical protein
MHIKLFDLARTVARPRGERPSRAAKAADLLRDVIDRRSDFGDGYEDSVLEAVMGGVGGGDMSKYKSFSSGVDGETIVDVADVCLGREGPGCGISCAGVTGAELVMRSRGISGSDEEGAGFAEGRLNFLREL